MKYRELYLALALALTACGGETGETPRAEEAPAPAEEATSEVEPGGYTVLDVTDGGTIRGTLRFVGTVPPPETVPVAEDGEVCGETRQVQTMEIGPGGGLAKAVVSLVDITRGAAVKAPATPPVLDQQGCRFVPHVLIVPAGATVEIANSDPITHNIHTVTFENRPVNRAQPKEVPKIEVSFPFADKVRVKCDIHNWMGAWIIVTDHPYHAISDRGGSFVIENVPPGTYTLEIWHETLGATTQTVTVTAGETTNVDVETSQS